MAHTLNKRIKELGKKMERMEKAKGRIKPINMFWMVLSNDTLIEAYGFTYLDDQDRLIPRFNPKHVLHTAWDEAWKNKTDYTRRRDELLWLYAQRHQDFSQKLESLWRRCIPKEEPPWLDYDVTDPYVHEVYEYSLLFEGMSKEKLSGYNYEFYSYKRRENYPTLAERHQYVLTHPEPKDFSNYSVKLEQQKSE